MRRAEAEHVGVEVVTARQDEPVDASEELGQERVVGDGGQDERESSGALHRLGVAGGELNGGLVAGDELAVDGDERSGRGGHARILRAAYPRRAAGGGQLSDSPARSR